MSASLKGEEFFTSDSAWKKWMSDNRANIGAGFEWEFTGQILAQIPDLDPSTVQAQVSFKDRNDKQRYIDFRILDKNLGIDIAIEVDGTYKDQDHQRWKDFLLRQNSMLDAVGILLRYSNKHFFDRPEDVIGEIHRQIQKQKNKFFQKQDLNLQFFEAQKKADLLSEELQRQEKEADVQRKELGVARGSAQDYRAKLDTLDEDLRRTREEAEELRQRLIDANEAQVRESDEESKAQSARLRADAERLIKENTSMHKSIVFLATMAVLGLAFIAGLAIINQGDGPNGFVSADPLPKPARQVAPQASSILPTSKAENRSLTKPRGNRCAKLEAVQAVRCIGAQAEVCGAVAEVSVRGRGTFLNIDGKFPNQPFTLVVWSDRKADVEDRVGGLQDLSGSRVCGVGEITSYKSRPQIIIDNPYNLIVMR